MPTCVRMSALLRLNLLRGNFERGIGNGNARIDGRLQERFLKIANLEFAGEAGPHVEAKLLPTTERGCNHQHQQTPGSLIQSRTRPDGSPGMTRNELLKIGIE